MATMRIISHAKQPKSFQFVAMKSAQKGATARRTSQHTPKKIILTILGVLFGIFVLVGIVGSIMLVGYIGTINASLPDAGELANKSLDQSTKIFDRNGTLLYTVHGDINREFVELGKIPEKTKWALLAAEDIEFYEHKGIDVPGIISAGIDYVRTGTRSSRGASTITQQLARNTVLVDIMGQDAYDVNLTRKLKEMLVAFQLENKLSKDQILELYMNEAPLGGAVYGFQTASKAYYNKDISKLTLSESALLAVILRAPTAYSTDIFAGEVEDVTKYRNTVLDLMLRYKDKTGVTEEEINAAKEEKIVITPGNVNITAPHFVFYVINQLEQTYGADKVKTGGLRVYTTLDLPTQRIAEDELKKNISYSKTQYGVYNGSVVILNPKNGETLAMVGSVNYNDKSKKVQGNVNVAIMPRQMGSSVKPYTYLAAIHQGYNPGSLAPDIKMTFGAYRPENWNFKYDGLNSMRRQLNQSRNLPAVYTLQLVGGTEKFIEVAKNLGISTLTQTDRYGLSLTLGAGDMKLTEHTNAFAVFANKGVRHDISSIRKITDSKGEEIFKSEPEKSAKRVYSEDEMYLMNWMMCAVGDSSDKLASHYYSAAGQKLCGKTGTTNGPKDLITIMYYPKLVVGVWTGNNDGSITFGRSQGWSENVPIVIVNKIMARLIPKYGKEFYTQPANIGFTTVCLDTGLAADSTTDCKKYTTPIIKGQGPAKDNAHKRLAICKKTGKIATNADEARAAGLISDIMYLDFTLPNAAQQKAYDTYVTEKLKYRLWKNKPTEEPCIADIAITFVTPTANAEYNKGDMIATSISITSVNAVNAASIQFTINGVNYGATYNILTGRYDCVGCKAPNNAPEGNLVISVHVTDINGLTGTGSRTVIVKYPVITPSPTPTSTPTPTITPVVTM
jgi:membrane peptidoglycan carboxypeptidase